jgi:flagellar biosynthesis regulator FlbT
METITQQKQDLVRLIESVNDPIVLRAIKDLLNHIAIDPIFDEKLVSRALKAEEDIKAGRVYSEAEFFNKSRENFSHR